MIMISVVIPTYNEAGNIGRCIEAIGSEESHHEIIVADGGSTDRTKEIAAEYPDVVVVDSDRGRGNQMNAGASAASGDVLLFLHADTILEAGWSCSMLESLEEGSVVGGAFTFAVDNPSWQYRLVEAWVQMRCAICRLPYGDQAIFIRRDVFRKLGGYRDIPLMEDVDLVARMKAKGKISILRERAFTAARRWEDKGLIRTALTNQIMMMLYKFGVSPEKLFRLYYR